MTEKHIHPEDQVDLTGLRTTLYELLRFFFRGLSFLGYCLGRYKYILTLSFVLGLGLGYGYYATRKSHYKASMIVQFSKINKRTSSQLVDQLNQFLGTAPKEKLAREMQISQAMAGKLLSVAAMDMDDRYLGADTSSKVDQPFKITAGVQDDFDFDLDTLQSGILNYLNNSPYLSRLEEVEKKHAQFKLDMIERDLAKLDTLKTEYNRFLASARVSSTFYSNAVNPADFYAQTLVLLHQRDLALRELNVNKSPAVMLDGLKLIEAPNTAFIPSVIALFGICTALFAFIVAVFAETKKRILNPAPRAPAQPQK